MGRPLNKKFFGNRNIGRNGREGTTGRSHNSHGEGTMHSVPAGDDGIGGKGIASYGSIVAGSGWTTQPDASISKPSLPGGVNAVGTFHYKALSAAVAVGGTTAYPVGTVVGVTGGSTFTVATLAGATTLSTVTIGTTANLTFSTTTLPIAVGTSILVGGVDTAGCNLALSTYYISASPAPTATAFTLTDSFANAILGTNTLSATNAGATTGLTFTTRSGTAPAGVVATVTKTADGDRTTFAATPLATTNTASATGLTLNVTYGLLSVLVTEKGSGYVNSADAALVFDPAATPTNASGVAAFVADTGFVGSATNQENAIIARVYYDEEVQIADIIKQQNARSYVVIVQSNPEDPTDTDKDDEPALAKLVNHVPVDNTPIDAEYPRAREMTIRATDNNGNTYFVTKLTAHKARLWRDTNNETAWLFTNGESAKWTFGATTVATVQIENA